jgi:hypothetical protein
MLKQAQATLHDDVLEDRSRGDVDGAAFCRDDDDSALERHTTAEVDSTSNGEVVQLQHLRDGGDSLLEVRDLLEVTTKLDEGSVTEAGGAHLKLTVLQCVEIRLDEHKVRAGLDRQESSTGNVDTVGVVEVTDGSTDSGLKLDNGDIGLSLLVTGNGLAVGDNLHLKLIVLNNALDGLEVKPDVVGVEVLELLDGLELVNMLLRNLGDFEQADRALVIDNGTTLDIGLGLVGQLHDVLGVGLHHVLEDAEIDDSAQVVDVGQEDDLNASLKELVENARVVQRLENITVTRRIPLVDRGLVVFGDGEERVLVNSWVSGLVEGKDVDVVSLVLLDNGGGVVICVERVHEDERDVDVVGAVKILDLSHGKVEEGHAITDLDNGLGTDATHGGTKTTVELENGELVEELDGLRVGKILVVDNLTLGGRGNAIPVNGVALGLVVEVSSEKSEEVVHLGLEQLLLLGVLDGLGEVGQRISHLSGSDVGRSVLESHVTARLAMATLVALLLGAGGLEVRRQRALDCTGHCEG